MTSYKVRYAERRAAGRCVKCSEANDRHPAGTRCSSCLAVLMKQQRAHAAACKAAGKCRYCGDPVNLYSRLCDAHGLRNTERTRRQKGCKAWRPGGRGRPPKGAQ